MKHCKNKKLTSIILAVVCLLSIAFSVTACTSETAVTQKSVLAEETTENTSEKTTAEVTVTAEPTTEAVTEKPTQKPTEKPTQKPTEKATEAVQSIKTDSLTSYVSPGEYASISITGAPNTDYSITVTYNSGPSTAKGLYTKTSDNSGYVSWKWKVGTRTAAGTYPIVISGGGQTITESFTVA